MVSRSRWLPLGTVGPGRQIAVRESNSVIRVNGLPLTVRPASKADLADVLRLYAKPALDNGQVISPGEAERMFERMARYPDYRVYVAVSGDKVIRLPCW